MMWGPVEPYPRCPMCGSLMQPLTPSASNNTNEEILWWCIDNTCNYNDLRSSITKVKDDG